MKVDSFVGEGGLYVNPGIEARFLISTSSFGVEIAAVHDVSSSMATDS